MEVLHLPLGRALEMVERGEIHDAKTIIGLLLVDRRLRDGNLGWTTVDADQRAAAGGRGVPVVDGHRARPSANTLAGVPARPHRLLRRG